MKKNILLIAAILWGTSTGYGQDEEKKPTVDYDLSTEVAVGTGRHTAYQLATNRYHSLSTRPNTANLHGAVTAELPLGHNFTLSGAVDRIGTVHAAHNDYLQ